MDWFNAPELEKMPQSDAAHTLGQDGFVVLPGPVAEGQFAPLAAAYDRFVRSAPSVDVRVGRTSTRIDNVVNSASEFDSVYLHAPLLEACRWVIGRPFKLSSLHARTLHPNVACDPLHVDVQRDSDAWPLAGFILMVDAFRPENGATRFLPGSHHWLHPPKGEEPVRGASSTVVGRGVQACGPAGSLIVFHGSTWHGHSANLSGKPRRSIQGAFIPRDGVAAVNWRERVLPSTLGRLSDLARYLLALSD